MDGNPMISASEIKKGAQKQAELEAEIWERRIIR
jgi:hypothetical protein